MTAWYVMSLFFLVCLVPCAGRATPRVIYFRGAQAFENQISNVDHKDVPQSLYHVSGYESNSSISASGGRRVEGWPRNAKVYDESLQYTFRGNDFLPETNWMSKPRVSSCNQAQNLSPRQAHRCDLLSLKFSVLTSRRETKMYWGRDYVHPFPDEDQSTRLRNGPFRDMAQRTSKLKRVTFVIHGYRDGYTPGTDFGKWQATLARQLVEGDSGADAVILVDWSRGAHATWEDCHGWECVDDYPVAMSDARVVGKYVQRLATGVREVVGDVHLGCIGHSVGAHVCGFAGKYMRQEELPAGGRLTLSRISALDPAGPSHSLAAELHQMIGGRSYVDVGYRLARLDRQDATFVDVYISDPGGFGYDIGMAVENADRRRVLESDMLGHLTFLINGQHYETHRNMQPGCESSPVKAGCSHHVAIESYTNTIVARNEELARRSALTKTAAPPKQSSSGFEAIWEALIYPIEALLESLRGAVQGSPAQLSSGDYCKEVEMHETLKKCDLPFDTRDGGAGNKCPVHTRQNVTFGVCAGPQSPEGLFMAPVFGLA